MERLTELGLSGQWTIAGDGTPTDRALKIPQILARLAAYEDTGLSPDDINDLLLKVATLETVEQMYDGLGHPDHLRELVQFEADGRLVVLPCNVGDSVWYIFASDELCEAKVTGVYLSIYTNPQLWLTVEYHSKIVGAKTKNSRVDLCLGKTVFLTREEAEAALERQKGGTP